VRICARTGVPVHVCASCCARDCSLLEL
jgi:hypothetical protein